MTRYPDLGFDTILQYKEPGLFEQRPIPELGQGTDKMNQEHATEPESTEGLREHRMGPVKWSQHERALNGQHWNNLNNKINNSIGR